MTPAFLVEQCKIHANGEGEALAITAPPGSTLQLTLGITEASEQSSLEVSVYTSSDGETWSPKPALVFPQRFYKGVAAHLLNVAEGSEVKFLLARWKVGRWGRGSLTPEFSIYIFAAELQ